MLVTEQERAECIDSLMALTEQYRLELLGFARGGLKTLATGLFVSSDTLHKV